MKFKNKKNNRKENFSQRGDAASPIDISELNEDKIDMNFILTGIVDRIVQTGGPTVFYISDGTGSIAIKSFEGAGVRAHSNIVEGDLIKAEVSIGEFQDELEGEVSRLYKLADEEKKDFSERIRKLERKRAEITPPEFMVKTIILDKLKERYIKAAIEIRLAIIQNRPIIIRHHNDTDGYSSGFSLERAILPLIKEQHTSVKAAWEFYTRAPCAAPFYEIEDSIQDTAKSLSNGAKFSNKMPLVIIADNGSSQEDLMGIQQGKVHGMDFIVVDHHFFEKDVISDEVLVHINPFLVGEDGKKFSAGMLCTELARFINPDVRNIEQIPAMAAFADRIDNPEVVESYFKIADKKGYNKSLLEDIASVIDFISSKLRFMEAREYIEVLFGEPMERQKALVKLMAPYIKKLENKGLEIAKSAVKIEKIGKTTIQILEIEETFSRGFYPKPGKCIGLLHDNIQKEKDLDNVVSLGVLSDAITIRATEKSNFSIHDLIIYLNNHLKEAFVEGGGHKNAGAIKFLPNKKKLVLEKAISYIKSLG